MRLTIEPTPRFFMLREVMVRMWQGTTEGGDEVVALVTAVAAAGQSAELATSLVSIPPPDADAAREWAEHILQRRQS